MFSFKSYFVFLSRNKAYTAINLVGFAVALMFVVILGLYVRGELSVDKFHEKGDRIHLFTITETDGNTIAMGSNPIGPWIVENYPAAESYVRLTGWDGDAIIAGGEPVTANGFLADSTFFSTFSFPLLEGSPTEVLARRKSMVVSRSFANKIFGADGADGADGSDGGVGSVVGRVVNFDEIDFTVTGVMADMPQNTIFPEADFVVDYGVLNELRGDDALNTHNNSGFSFFIVEREGADLNAHTDDMMARFKEFWWLFQDNFATEVGFVPLEEVYFGGIEYASMDFRSNSLTAVMLYLGIALLILVVALLNYINMTVAQAGFRGREVAMKKLLGSSRGAIVGQLLAESLMMTAASFVLGLGLAFACEGFFDGVLNTTLGLAGSFTVPVVAAMVGAILVLAVISGIVPALVMSSFKPIEIVKGSFNRRVKGVYSRILVIFQYTVSMGLLICSAVIVLQSRYLATRDVGLERDGVMLIENVAGVEQSKTVARQLSGIPGVEAVSRVRFNPFDAWGGNWSFDFEGEPQSFEQFQVDSVFFRLFDVTFEPTGVDPRAENAIYLNRVGYNALKVGERNNEARINENNIYTVVGILSDFHFRPLQQAQGPMMLRINENARTYCMAVKIAAGADLVAVSERVMKEYTSFVGTDRVQWQWADDTVHEFYQQERRTSRIMGAFTVLVILILLMGILAMSIYTLRQKRKEIALRKVNGSTVGEILARLGGQSLVAIAVAFVIACPVAWYAMSRWLESFPYRIGLGAWIFAAALVVVATITLLTVMLQTWHAATENPVKSLKSE